ncbi:LON peptidase substrate-binding domain-containing protein [Cecembia sp.]|uniref:LON peptidase substrate-binding domain-containing protein n=1 Tax=Cecembia sp. TaxID=1898110 RepID=UPI0025C58352|nr:LON peptidase substrate-binding domain-containing protein [Cecembia sp.]
MPDYLPIFPLKLVAFPGEALNLHIFEPRYRQLVHDIKNNGGRFGIGIYLDSLVSTGTEVELIEINKTYDDGRMDIKTVGKRVFEILTFDNPSEGKLYAGGKVQFLDNDPRVAKNVYDEFLFYLKELFRLMNQNVELNATEVDSFTFAHKIGLKIEEEYELLQLKREEDRMKYLIQHLMRVISVLREVELAKLKIKMNGHYKNLDPLDL